MPMGHAHAYDPTPIWGLTVNYHRMWHTFLLPNIIKQAGMTYCIAAPLKAPVYVTRLSTFWVSNPMMVGGMIVSRGNTIWGILEDKVKPSNITAHQSGERYHDLQPRLQYFLKPFLKGKMLRSGEWERGKFDFDHHFGFLTLFLKR